MARGIFPQCFDSFPYGKHCFQCPVFVSRCRLYLRYTAGNFNKNPSMPALAKILRARASEHSSNYCEQFEQRQNFASTFELDGTTLYPSYECCGALHYEHKWWNRDPLGLSPSKGLTHSGSFMCFT